MTLPKGLLAACLISGACHPGGVKLAGTVTVPVEVQRLFSAADPGRVVVYGQPADGGGWFAQRTLRYLCDPGAEPLMLSFEVEDDYACAVQATFRADIDHVPTAAMNRVKCGQGDEITGSFVRENVVATGSQPLFPDKARDGCEGGSATVEVTVALLPKP
jgi:hypothetical protein